MSKILYYSFKDNEICEGGILMTFNSKRTITNMAAGIIFLVIYIFYALQKHAQGITGIKDWATAMLLFIGAGIVGAIIIQIVFHIAFAIGVAIKECERGDKDVERIVAASVTEDERDKLINMKASHIGYVIAGIGFIAALASWHSMLL